MNFMCTIFITATASYHIAISIILGTVSHVLPYFEIVQPLIDQGNTVTFLAPKESLGYPKQYPNIATHGIEINPNHTMSAIIKRFKSALNHTKMDSKGVGNFMGILLDSYQDAYVGIDKFDKQHHIDLLVCVAYNYACIDYGHYHGKKMIVLGHLGFMGVAQTWYSPSAFSEFTQEELVHSWYKRMQYKYDSLQLQPSMYRFNKRVSKIKKNLGIETPGLPRILKQHLYIAHNVFGLVGAREMPPNVLAVGPLLPKTIKPLEQDTQQELDNFEKHGISVIYIAFGTAANITGPISEKIFDACKRVLQDTPNTAVIWSLVQTESNQLQIPLDLQGRFILKKWVNQRALIVHPAVKIFLTHGGISSIHEGIYAGIPMIVTGIFADQFANAKAVAHAHLGYENKKLEFTAEGLKIQIGSLLSDANDPTSLVYKSVQKMKKIARLNSEMHVKTVINMFEMAATVGYDHLVPITAKMTWWQSNGQYYVFLLTTLTAAYPILKYVVKGLKLRKSMK
ncbi:hypothetical protein HDV01_003443 [Terramyces sp. JEL0728]|nr:hypothetical protein HDV01_003443 [Terramyces sp. JEL0728]